MGNPLNAIASLTRLSVAISLLFGACGSDQKANPGGAETATADIGEAPTTTCTHSGIEGQSFLFKNVNTGTVGFGLEGDGLTLQLEFYDIGSGNPLQGPGPYRLGSTIEDQNYATCAICARVHSEDKDFFAVDGVVEVTSLDFERETIDATISGATFVEVTIDFEGENPTFESTPVPNGETWCVQGAAIRLENPCRADNCETGLIGPEGGSLTSSTGVTIDIPPSALMADKMIGIQMSDETYSESGTPAGSSFLLTPEGLLFESEVTITLPFTPNGSTPSVLIASHGTQNWRLLGGQLVDESHISASTIHFSNAQAVYSPICVSSPFTNPDGSLDCSTSHEICQGEGQNCVNTTSSCCRGLGCDYQRRTCVAGGTKQPGEICQDIGEHCLNTTAGCCGGLWCDATSDSCKLECAQGATQCGLKCCSAGERCAEPTSGACVPTDNANCPHGRWRIECRSTGPVGSCESGDAWSMYFDVYGNLVPNCVPHGDCHIDTTSCEVSLTPFLVDGPCYGTPPAGIPPDICNIATLQATGHVSCREDCAVQEVSCTCEQIYPLP